MLNPQLPSERVKTRLLSGTAKMPCFMTKGAACADVFLPADVTIPPMDLNKSLKDNIVKIPLDVAFDIPAGLKIVMYPRSSLLIKRGLVQPVSIIDEDYHGNAHVPLVNITNEPIVLKAGERAAQIEVQLAMAKGICDWDMVEGERDQNGFGGTGK